MFMGRAGTGESVVEAIGPVRLALRDAEHTRRLGEAIATRLLPGDCLACFGPVGAGKTTLIQGVARGIGSPVAATSPSFVLVHHYEGHPPLLHADLYRLASPEEIEDLMLPALADELGAAIAIEWSERDPAGLPEDRLEIRLDFATDGDGRVARLLPRGPRSAALAEEVGAA
jgi:tRNA threonylcarbamoyladenosine biosynthesis protein TsaE